MSAKHAKNQPAAPIKGAQADAPACEGAAPKEQAPDQQEQAVELPTTAELQAEVDRRGKQRRFAGAILSTTNTLITVAAVAVLVAVLLLPVLQIYGTSMNPTLDEGNIVVSVKGTQFETGDVVAFYYNNNVLVKRVIAQAGQWVDIDQDGNVYVDGVRIEEPYVTEKSLGECNIDLPYQVPESRIFVMGDNRDVSIDSRNTSVGCIAEEQLVGKIVFRVWPLMEIGAVGR